MTSAGGSGGALGYGLGTGFGEREGARQLGNVGRQTDEYRRRQRGAGVATRRGRGTATRTEQSDDLGKR